MKKVFLILFYLILSIPLSFSQSLSHLKNLKVEDLSDAQIDQLFKKAEASGLSTLQLEAMAREQGMSPLEAAKLRERIEKSSSSLTANRRSVAQPQQRSFSAYTEETVFDSLRKADPYYDLTPFQKKIFGNTLFHNRNLDFNPSMNLPTPQS